MTDDINFKNNPLHGLSLKNLLVELVDHYGFDILFAYLNINCFKSNPSIESCIKFLKKTQWAREKVEGFYLYQYKSLPKASSTQFAISPRDRIILDHHEVGEPAELSLEDAEQQRERRAKKAAEYNRSGGYGQGKRQGTGKPQRSNRPARTTESKSTDSNPWGNWEK